MCYCYHSYGFIDFKYTYEKRTTKQKTSTLPTFASNEEKTDRGVESEDCTQNMLIKIMVAVFGNKHTPLFVSIIVIAVSWSVYSMQHNLADSVPMNILCALLLSNKSQLMSIPFPHCDRPWSIWFESLCDEVNLVFFSASLTISFLLSFASYLLWQSLSIPTFTMSRCLFYVQQLTHFPYAFSLDCTQTNKKILFRLSIFMYDTFCTNYY